MKVYFKQNLIKADIKVMLTLMPKELSLVGFSEEGICFLVSASSTPQTLVSSPVCEVCSRIIWRAGETCGSDEQASKVLANVCCICAYAHCTVFPRQERKTSHPACGDIGC